MSREIAKRERNQTSNDEQGVEERQTTEITTDRGKERDSSDARRDWRREIRETNGEIKDRDGEGKQDEDGRRQVSRRGSEEQGEK